MSTILLATGHCIGGHSCASRKNDATSSLSAVHKKMTSSPPINRNSERTGTDYLSLCFYQRGHCPRFSLLSINTGVMQALSTLTFIDYGMFLFFMIPRSPIIIHVKMNWRNRGNKGDGVFHLKSKRTCNIVSHTKYHNHHLLGYKEVLFFSDFESNHHQ